MDGRNPFRTTLKPWEPSFVGMYRRIIIPLGFLGGARFRPSTVSPIIFIVLFFEAGVIDPSGPS